MNIEQEDQYQNQSKCQDYEDYRPEGYHPAYINQILNNKYQIIQKLGWGHFSTVWLIKAIDKQQYSAVKIQRSKRSHAETAKDEVQLLKILRKHQNNKQWIQLLESKFGIQSFHVVNPRQIYSPLLLLDSFIHLGINGKHYCNVFQLMGPNLLDLIQHYEFKGLRMPINFIKHIIRDILVGLVYLHNFCKMIHTDLKPQNIMMKLTKDEQKKFVEGLKKYKKIPLSMKYLKRITEKIPQKNKKKLLEQKKQKKKALRQSQQIRLYQNFQENEKVLKEIQSSHVISEFYTSNSIPDNLTQKSSGSQSELSQLNLTNEQYNRTSVIEQKITNLITQLTQKTIKNNQNKDNIFQKSTKILEQNIQQEKIKKKKKKNKKINQTTILNKFQKIITKSQKNPQVSESFSSDQNKKYTQDQIEHLQWKNIKIYLHQGLSFKIADYGNATLHDNHVNDDQIQTRQYRSPEVILGHEYEYNTDIWSLACIVYQMLTNTFLFKPRAAKNISEDQDHIYKMQQLLGIIDKNFALKGRHSKQLMNKKGQLINGNPTDFLSISQLLNEDYHYTINQSKEIQNFLKPMLEYQPSKRISALDCLKSEWLWKN